jgi:hypothetical protein
MATALLSISHALQASFSAYTLYLSSISIRNLQKYEETSKKAAKYSNIAEQQLHKTRTTQASGALSVPSLFSFPKTPTNSLRGPLLVLVFDDTGVIPNFLFEGRDNWCGAGGGRECSSAGNGKATRWRVLGGEGKGAAAWRWGI